jgi:HlyD family secretion protein
MKGGTMRWLLPALAVCGLAFALYYSMVTGRRELPPPNQLAMPAENPFASAVSGSGLVEANSRNIAVGSFVSGIVADVPVREGQWVNAGAPLFALDPRLAEADLAVAEREQAAARAHIAEAEAALADQADQLRRVERLEPGISVTEDRKARVQFAYRAAQTLVEAARAQAETARARVQAARVTLDRLTVRAPIEGRVLKINVRPGEFVTAAPSLDPLVLLGNDRPLHVRVQIDENDVWRLNPNAPAEAVVRGNRNLRFPLAFVRVEPWVLPKRSLTGDRTERIDTRVLEVIYSFDPGEQPVFIGQQMDVFIRAADF